MEELITHWVEGLPLVVLFIIIALTMATLSKGADLLVDEAVALSRRAGISKLLIGATIVSLGTTLPEASVSVMSALAGDPELSLGNAVGSIICDTGLILGLAALIGRIPLDPAIVKRQGWIQFGSGLLLVAASIPYSRIGTVFTQGGRLPQFMGIIFVVLLIIYFLQSVRWAREDRNSTSLSGVKEEAVEKAGSILIILFKLILGITLVILSSKVLIPTVQETALRLRVPRGIIAATLVAFGTSLPELITALTAVRKGHGEIALGNIIGADILNVLFVSGLSAAVTPGGLTASSDFFVILFPSMMGILIIFRVGIALSKGHLKKPFAGILLGIYLAITILSYGRI